MTDVDLHAYVDDQLDAARRLEVEDYLAGHPEAAASVMSMLRMRDALRLCVQAPLTAPGPLRGSAQRLEQALRRQLAWRALTRAGGLAAAVLALVSAFAAATMGLLPPSRSANAAEADFVDDALDAQRALLARQRMASQLETPRLDIGEIEAVAGLTLPPLPANWRLRDVQLYPWDEGYSLGLTAEVEGVGPVALFVAPVQWLGKGALRTSRQAGEHVVYWRTGTLGFALSGQATSPELLALAREVAGVRH
ncbi:anti-sigma factor family protein [Parapedomonas caeni]